MARRARPTDADVHGVVVVDKPAGMTSHDVVAELRRNYGLRRVGHAGTLDPDATGVLLVGVGRATRLLRFLQDTTKVYCGVVVFGTATTTLDASGTVVARTAMSGLRREQVELAAAASIGDIMQTPPMVSAVKVGGRRLHELAREGIEVERAPRPVTISRFEVEEFGEEPDLEGRPAPTATVLVECSSGTYVRVLAADLGHALGGHAHLGRLRRTAVGQFTVDDAHSLDAIAADPLACLLPPSHAVRGMAHLTVSGPLEVDVRRGRSLPGAGGSGSFAVFGEDGELLAVYAMAGTEARPLVVVGTGD